MKYYHIIIEKNAPWGICDPVKTQETRREIIRSHITAPAGWHVVGVCGYHEEPTKREKRGGAK